MSRQLQHSIYGILLLVGAVLLLLPGQTVLAQVINLPGGVQIGVPSPQPAPGPAAAAIGRGESPGGVIYDSPSNPAISNPASPYAPGAYPPGGLDGTGEEVVTSDVPATTLGNPLYDLLYSFVLTVFGSLLAMAGGLMSYGMNEFVLGFGTQYFEKNVGQAVEATWTVIRDLFNLTFIFGLVYIGFKMILDSSDSRARSMLISLIGAALLVNFSLFIVKFIIDVANITAVMIAKNGFVDANGVSQDIANSFINLINLSTILNISQSQVSQLAQNGGAFAYIFGLMIFLATATFVLAAAGILFIVRFVVLNIYLVMSPIMFIGWVFPSMQSYSTKFWSGFLGNAFFAPAYLLMIYLSYTVLTSYKFSLGKTIDYGRLMAASGDPQDAISMMHVVPFFVLAMVFMVASLVVAKKMGAVGASTAVSFGNKLRGSAQGAMYRNTGGRLSKGALNFMDKTGMSKLPGTRGLRSGLKSGYEYGAGGTGLAKTRSEIKSEKADITENRSRMQGLKDTKTGKRQVSTAESNTNELASLRGRDFSTLTDVEKGRLTTLESEKAKADKFITGLDKSEIEALSPAERASYATRFTADQVSKIMESDKISTGEKNKVFGARIDSISSKIGGSSPIPSQTMKLSRDELDTLGFDWAAKNAHNLTQTQFDDYIKNSKKVTPEIAESLKNRRKVQLLDGITNGSASRLLTELSKKPKEFAQLPLEVFTSLSTYNSIIPHLTSGILEEIAKEGKLDQAQRFAMRDYLSAPGRGTATQVLNYFASDEGAKKYGP